LPSDRRDRRGAIEASPPRERLTQLLPGHGAHAHRAYYPHVTSWDHFKVGRMVRANLRPDLLERKVSKRC